MRDFATEHPEEYAEILAMIPLAEGKPMIHVDAKNGATFFCHRIHGLHVESQEWTFYGECQWAKPAEERPDELTDGMTVSCGDCLRLGPGWWYDGYFDWYYIYDPLLVTRSQAGDYEWVSNFLKNQAADPH